MAITRYLTSQPYVNAGDQVIILAERNGDMRRTSVAAISDFVKAAIAAGGGSSGGGGSGPATWGNITGVLGAQSDLWAALQNKQPLLPSGGTASNYLRGDGVWAVPPTGGSSAATWGAITGTLSSQADLINALNAKEGILPAGTAIQYIRGNKTLGTLDKAAVGLSSVDNTSDAGKPISNAAQSALDSKEPTIAPGNTTQYWRGDKTWQTLPTGGSGAAWGSITGSISSQTDLSSALAGKEPAIAATSTAQYFRGDKTFQTLDKTAVGLGNVDNTSDANKPVSTATSTALALKAPLASPAFTGIPTVPTAAVGTNTTQAASTAFVLANAGSGGGGTTYPGVFVPTAGGGSEAIQAAINAAKAAGVGTVWLGNATWTCNTAITVDARKVNLEGAGAVLDFSGAGDITYMTVTATSGDSANKEWSGFSIKGPGKGAGGRGILFYNSNASGQTCLVSLRNIQVTNMSTCYEVSDNAFLIRNYNVALGEATLCYKRGSAVNNGEAINWYGGILFNSDQCLNLTGPNQDHYFYGTSFDYCKKIGYTDSHAEFHGCHFESSSAVTNGATQFEAYNGGVFKFFGGEIGLCTDGVKPDYLFALYGSNQGGYAELHGCQVVAQQWNLDIVAYRPENFIWDSIDPNMGRTISAAYSPTRVVGGNVTLDPRFDSTLLADASSGSFTITLPTAAQAKFKEYAFKKTNAANTVTIDANGTELIDGALTAALTAQYSILRIKSDGSAWQVVSAAGGAGGFPNPMTTQGDLIVGGTSGTPTRTAAGALNYVLTSNGPGAAPTWKVPTGSGASNANAVSYDAVRGPSRTQLAKNRETISIYDFGAIGTGTFDNNPLSTRYATLQDAQNAYPTLTNLSLSDQIDWAALQSGVDYMQSTGKILDLAGAKLCVNRETIFRNAGFIFIKGSRSQIGGKRMAKAWISDGSTVAVDTSYPTATNPGPVGGCCFYASTVPYYAYIEDIDFNDFRFGVAFFNDPNSPIFKNCNFNYTNCGVIYYLGCQNPRYVNCGGGQLGVLHVSSVTAFPSDHPYVGNDNYYSDNVTITNEVGYASIGSQPSAGFDNFLRDSILRPTVDSTTAAGTRKYSDRNNVTYTDPFFLNATGRICYMPFRNLRDCFSFTMHADSRGGLRYGYALVNTEIAALELYANNYEQLFQALPDSDTTASLLTCGSVFSGTMQMASQIDYIEKAHPMVKYTGRGQSRGFTDGGGITLLGTSIIARKGDKFLGFNNGVLQANRQFMGIDEFTQGRTQGRADTNAPADFTWYLNGRETFTNVYPGRMMIESNPLIIDLPFKTADNVRRVNALVSLNMGFAGYLKATVYNANAGVPVDSAVYYWDSLASESFTLNQAVNNGDTTVVMSGSPNGQYSSPRFSKWTFDAQSPKGFLMDGYLSGTSVQPLSAISGLSGTVASGTVVRRSEKLQVVRAFTQSWVRLGIFNSSEGTVPFHGAGSLGVRNLLAGDTAPNDSPELRVVLTLHHMYPG